MKTMKRRSGEAVAARSRTSAGPMKHRLEPKGGTRARNQDSAFCEEECDGTYLTEFGDVRPCVKDEQGCLLRHCIGSYCVEGEG